MLFVHHRHTVLHICVLVLIGCLVLTRPATNAESLPPSTMWASDPTFGSNGRLVYNPVEPYTPSLNHVNVQFLPDNIMAVQFTYTYRWGKSGGYGSKSVWLNEAGELVNDITLPKDIVGVQSTGKFIMFDWDWVTEQSTLRRYTRDLALDPTFAMIDPFQSPYRTYECCYTITIQADDTILVGIDHYVIRLTRDGATDLSFVHPVGPFGSIRLVVSHPNGGFLVKECTDNQCAVRQYAADGAYVTTLDSSSYFGDSLDNFAATPALDGGWVWVADESGIHGGDQGSRTVIYKSTGSGTLDPTFGTNGKVKFWPNGTGVVIYPLNLAVDPNGHIVLAGMLQDTRQQTTQPFVARLTRTGTFDSNFGSQGLLRMATNESRIWQIAPQMDGTIVLVTSTFEGLVVRRLAEYTVQSQVFLPVSAQ